jgi:biopolymer transport protein ExbD
VRRFDQINVIPFIDIMLVLLAIVLTSASFIAQGKLPLDLPEAESAAPLTADQTLQIAVDREGAVHLDGEPVSLKGLEARLAMLGQDVPIVLRVDAAAQFQGFVAVIDRLKAHDQHRVSIVTRPAP